MLSKFYIIPKERQCEKHMADEPTVALVHKTTVDKFPVKNNMESKNCPREEGP